MKHEQRTHFLRSSRAMVLLLLLCCMLLTACGKDAEEDLLQKAVAGDWAYIHDPQTTILQLGKNGKASYQGKNFTYTVDDTYLYLKSDSEQLNLRYEKDGEEFYLYQPCDYTYEGEGAPDGIVGRWVDKETRWSYEFTDDGTFREDGYFPGYYTQDADNGQIKLVYNDQFYDTTLYYTLDGDRLHIEYPWSMVKAQ
ncbi:MAG: hypothetical protein K6A92_02500 [Lachnospiraceae bacterium]|nr:hypothetical protein [Lachnospiraceae bacterium]